MAGEGAAVGPTRLVLRFTDEVAVGVNGEAAIGGEQCAMSTTR